jgi:Ca2+:H+ antiporter
MSRRFAGATSSLAALIALATLSLVLPSFTTSSPGATYTNAQLTFAAVASLALWAIFVFVQTVQHRDYFLPTGQASNEEVHAAPPSVAQAWTSFVLLLVSLLAVVGLAKVLSPSIEAALRHRRAKTVIGIVIARWCCCPKLGPPCAPRR